MNKKMTQRYIETIRQFVLKELESEDVSIALFGSFTTGANTDVSDIDIAVLPKGKWKRSKLSQIREKLEELTIPYTVDLVDFSMVSEQFRKTALTNVLWWRM
ncbi:MAG: nucleotidyltransferase domain-containing protein [Bacteroidota bacterium]